MTTSNDRTASQLNDPAEIDRYLSGYAPTGLSPQQWAVIAPDVIPLVKRAGRLTLSRVARDIKVLASVTRRLSEQGRVLSLDEILADATLLDYDLALQRAGTADGTRARDRGILRRLQAVHREVPWRRERRADGERITSLPSPAVTVDLDRLVERAQRDGGQDAATLLAVVDAARRARRGHADTDAGVDRAGWERARTFAARCGVTLTAHTLGAAVTHEVLLRDEPLAVVAGSCRLTRRDLDLGLSHAAALGELSAQQRTVLRGA